MITWRAARSRLRRLFVGLFVEDDDPRHVRRRPTALDEHLVEPDVRGTGGGDVVLDEDRPEVVDVALAAVLAFVVDDAVEDRAERDDAAVDVVVVRRAV